MREITRVGVDLAKHVIQVHAVDATGTVVTNRPLLRDKFMARVRSTASRLHGRHGSELQRASLGATDGGSRSG